MFNLICFRLHSFIYTRIQSVQPIIPYILWKAAQYCFHEYLNRTCDTPFQQYFQLSLVYFTVDMRGYFYLLLRRYLFEILSRLHAAWQLKGFKHLSLFVRRHFFPQQWRITSFYGLFASNSFRVI